MSSAHAPSQGRARLRPLLFLGTITALTLLLPWPSAWIERLYVGGLYPALSRLIVPVTEALPLPLTPLLFLAAAAYCWAVPRTSGRVWRRRLWRLVLTTELLLLWFALAWGLAYRRPRVEQLLELPRVGIAASDLEALAGYLVDVVRTDAEADRDEQAAIVAVRGALTLEAGRLHDFAPTLPRRLDLLPAGTLLTFSVAGVISPWTLEAHLDRGLPPAARVAVAAHELAHLAGFAGEADAELVGALAGLRAENGFARYAVALGQYQRLRPALSEEARQRLDARLPTVASDDLEATAAAASRYRNPWLAEASDRLYDLYLRSRGVAAGTGDYGRATTLLARAWRGGMLGAPPGPPVESPRAR